MKSIKTIEEYEAWLKELKANSEEKYRAVIEQIFWKIMESVKAQSLSTNYSSFLDVKYELCSPKNEQIDFPLNYRLEQYSVLSKLIVPQIINDKQDNLLERE